MPDLAANKTSAVAYPPQTLYDSWDEHAEDLDMSTSQFIIRMVEAGRQNISMDDASATSTRDLLQERADLKREIQRQRDRIKDLERQLQHSSQSEIVSFITDNPGTTTPDIIQDVADSVPARVASHLDALEGKVVEQRSDGYYPLETES